MLEKIKAFTDKYAIITAFIAFLIIDLLLHGVAALLNLMPDLLPLKFLSQVILIAIPIAIVFLFGFGSTFRRKNFFSGLLCGLPYIVGYSLTLVIVLVTNLGNPELTLQPWYMILYSLFSILCVGIREECIYRATVQNIVAKKYANSVKGIWITAIVGAVIFGLMHLGNLFVGVERAETAQSGAAFISGRFAKCQSLAHRLAGGGRYSLCPEQICIFLSRKSSGIVGRDSENCACHFGNPR